MKIVIDIPEETYNKILKNEYDYGDMNMIIQNGTPLPKGHGRLIDADELLIKSEWYGERSTYSNPMPNGEMAVPEEVVLNAPTIIEGSDAE